MSVEAVEIAQEASAAVEKSGGLGVLGINLEIFIAQLVNFLVVLFVLWKWAYKPVVKMLERREETIARGVRDAQEAGARLEAVAAQAQETMGKAQAQAAEILGEALSQAQVRRDQLLSKAKAEVEEVVARGKKELSAQKEQMVREAREQLVDVALTAAGKVLREKMDAAKSAALAQEALAELVK